MKIKRKIDLNNLLFKVGKRIILKTSNNNIK